MGSGTLIYTRAAGTLSHQTGSWKPHLQMSDQSPIYNSRPAPRRQTKTPSHRASEACISVRSLSERGAPALSEAGARLLCRERASGQRTHGWTCEGLWRWRCGCSGRACREPQRCAPDGLYRDGGTSEARPRSRRSRQPTLGLCSQTALTLSPLEHPTPVLSGGADPRAAARGSPLGRKRGSYRSRL